jgi:hypothetical protein
VLAVFEFGLPASTHLNEAVGALDRYGHLAFRRCVFPRIVQQVLHDLR